MQREQQRDKDVAERLQRLEEGQNNMAQKVEQDVDRRLVEDPAYSRPPNRTILRLGTQDDTKIIVIRDVCRAWLDCTVADNLWTITGPDVGAEWTLFFLATPTAAATYASKARTSLNISRGKWRKLFAKADNGTEGQLYVSEDVRPKVARAQTATKRLVEIFKTAHAGKSISCVKPRYHPQRPIQGIIQMEGMDVCAVKAEAQFELPEIFWSPEATDARLGIDKPAITEAFQERMQASGGRAIDTSSWCK